MLCVFVQDVARRVPLVDRARAIQTNLLGILYGSHFALRQFRGQGYGILINIASVSGKMGVSAMTANHVKFQYLRVDPASRMECSDPDKMSATIFLWKFNSFGERTGQDVL
jgi:NAD(P)-dependent dehydrogenase (short-subunit alcohol dehydrogenase family)